LKEWPAFHALKRTVDDFNDMCPLLELMANKAMKPRHWQRIMEVLKHNFDLESENFCLKNILEAPLLKYKEDIEVSQYCCCCLCPHGASVQQIGETS
jgi:dynein heavy chain